MPVVGSVPRDRVKQLVSGAPGVGTVTLGAAVSDYVLATTAGVINGETNTWVLDDPGVGWEVHRVAFTSGGNGSLARTTSTLLFNSAGSSSLLTLDASTVCWIDTSSQDLPNAMAWMLGDGADGNVTVNSGVTLSRDMYYQNLTLTAGAALNTNGWRIFVAGVFDATAAPAGAIFNNGSNGGAAASTASPGAAGPSAPVNSVGGLLFSGLSGIAGTTGQGFVGNQQTSGIALLNGGANGATGASGAGTNSGRPAIAQGSNNPAWPTAPPALVQQSSGNSNPGPGTLISGGLGGSAAPSGGGDGTNQSGSSGGGGGGGGVIGIFARYVKRNGAAAGAIQAKGGNAGAGFAPTLGNTGGAGGSVGAGGGWVFILVGSFLDAAAANMVDVTGGNGAAGTNGHGTGIGGDGGGSGAGGTFHLVVLSSGSITRNVGVATTAGTAHTGITGGAGATATASQFAL